MSVHRLNSSLEHWAKLSSFAIKAETSRFHFERVTAKQPWPMTQHSGRQSDCTTRVTAPGWRHWRLRGGISDERTLGPDRIIPCLVVLIHRLGLAPVRVYLVPIIRLAVHLSKDPYQIYYDKYRTLSLASVRGSWVKESIGHRCLLAFCNTFRFCFR